MSSTTPVKFGTDGVRGRAYDQLTLADARRIGQAAATVFGADHAVIGVDTRESGVDFARALAAGFSAGGGAVHWLGVAPTPAVAHYAAVHASVGIMVSASHNPWFDNGIKLFAPGGRKLTDAEQTALEAELTDTAAASTDSANADPTEASNAVSNGSEDAPALMVPVQESVALWADLVRTSCQENALTGMHVVLDAANGAGSHISAPILADLGATVEVMHASPDGRNINEQCGSTHPDSLAARVVESGADVGIALDGDADRLVAVDANGVVVDGDAVIAICALDMARRDVLTGNAVVVTVMTNLGFRIAMAERGIDVVETPVGDRHVLAALEAHGLAIGGEQSGHVIFSDIASTGDGLLTAVQLLSVVASQQRPLHELAAEAMTRLPQVLRNVRVSQTVANVAEQISVEIESAQAALGDTGRVLIRASGTEPVIRVMVEAASADLAESVCNDLVAVVEQRFA